jgi:hypothetical protein
MSEYRKFAVALLTALITAASRGLLPEPYVSWVPVAVSFAGAFGVAAVRNGDKPAPNERH